MIFSMAKWNACAIVNSLLQWVWEHAFGVRHTVSAAHAHKLVRGEHRQESKQTNIPNNQKFLIRLSEQVQMHQIENNQQKYAKIHRKINNPEYCILSLFQL